VEGQGSTGRQTMCSDRRSKMKKRCLILAMDSTTMNPTLQH
jgi:hypothetical protein